MKYVESTAEVILFKVLNRDITEVWINWAYEMIKSGFETENILILAGEVKPYNQFELQRLTDKIIDELSVPLTNIEEIIKKYVCYLIGSFFKGRRKASDILQIICNLYLEKDLILLLIEFAHLHWTLQDLELSEQQWYWPGATRENIDKIIENYFIKWKSENCV